MHIQQRQGRFRNRVGRREEKGKGGCGQGEIFQKSILLLCCVVEFVTIENLYQASSENSEISTKFALLEQQSKYAEEEKIRLTQQQVL